MSYALADHRFLHVGFNFRSGPTKVAELEALFNNATSWYRYAPNCWILWTNGTALSWYNFLAPHITKDDYMFIVELNMRNYYGWLPKNAWDWIKERTG
jgi:hypothetical protein